MQALGTPLLLVACPALAALMAVLGYVAVQLMVNPRLAAQAPLGAGGEVTGACD